ncbi:hypothetical protein DFH06DRAFT_1337310 [Mycena polygramma]|nr:hypothetical protein DFH06DRAFT_1337310 [Mycena polygramma]
MASPFTDQLGTNYCPSDEEALEIQRILVEPTLRMKRLDDEIAKLAEERDSLRAFVQPHKALISPFRRTPFDIIQEIFIACLPTHRNCVMSASEAPVLLGRICSSWRAISLSTPRLWSRLHVVEPFLLHRQQVAQRTEATKTWLERSGHCPLSISLQHHPHFDVKSLSQPLPGSPIVSGGRHFFQTLLAFAHRWQHIRFTTRTVMEEDLVHLTAADVPMLESIAFNCDGIVVKWEQLEMFRAPRIRSFSLSGINFSPEHLFLLWSQLTDLTIAGCPSWGNSLTSGTLLQLLTKCPQLRSCKLPVSDGQGRKATGNTQLLNPTVELPLLHTLELNFNTASMVINHLSLPQLRKFSLRGRADAQNPFSLAPLLASCVRLEELSIERNTFRKSTLLDRLRSLPPTLRRLTIFDAVAGMVPGPRFLPVLDDDALTVLAQCCPALETFDLIHCTLISDAAFLQFIVAMMTGRSRPTLTRVDVDFTRFMTFDILPSLAPFIEQGLGVSVRYWRKEEFEEQQIEPMPCSPRHGLVDGDPAKRRRSRARTRARGARGIEIGRGWCRATIRMGRMGVLRSGAGANGVLKVNGHGMMSPAQLSAKEEAALQARRAGAKRAAVQHRIWIRIYEADNTYHVVSVSPNVTVGALTPKLDQKLPVGEEREMHQLYLKERGRDGAASGYRSTATGTGGVRYDETDGQDLLGGAVLAFLLKFVYKSLFLEPAEEELKFDNFEYIDLTVSLRLSRNPIIEIPLRFIQSCTTLRELRLSHMAMKKVPHSLRHSTTLIASTSPATASSRSIPRQHPGADHAARAEQPPRKAAFRTFPAGVSELMTLRDLHISFNSISEVPEEIGQLKTLERLVIVGNQVSRLPDEFSNLGRLGELDCWRNQISDLIVACMLPKIETLSADHNALHDLALSMGPCLTTLDVSHNEISQLSILSVLDGLTLSMTSLRRLKLDNNSFRSIPDSLGDLKWLETLSCTDSLLGELPQSIGRLQKLETLDVHNNSLTELPVSLWNCASLSRLNVTSNFLVLWHDPPPSVPEEDTASTFSDIPFVAGPTFPNNRKPSTSTS